MSTEYSKLNGLILPTPLLDEINEASNYFGSGFEQMIFNSIERNLLDKDPEVISALNESFQKVNFIKETLKKNEEYINSIEESDSANIDLSCTFWGKIENSLGKKLNIVIEGASPEQIEGDGEVAQHADDESQEGQEGQEGQEQQLQPEQVLQMELAQTDNKFMAIVLYNKMGDLITTIDTIMDTVSSSKTEENLDLFQQLELYQEYLNILLELIFVMDLNTVYYNFTNISIFN